MKIDLFELRDRDIVARDDAPHASVHPVEWVVLGMVRPKGMSRRRPIPGVEVRLQFRSVDNAEEFIDVVAAMDAFVVDLLDRVFMTSSSELTLTPVGYRPDPHNLKAVDGAGGELVHTPNRIFSW